MPEAELATTNKLGMLAFHGHWNVLRAEHRLATYGSLSPGKLHNDQLDGIDGYWRSGLIRGRLVDAGPGSPIGFPGLVLDAEAFGIPVSLFESRELPAHWSRLDAFEGRDYRRVVATVDADGELLNAFVYVLAELRPLARR